MEVLALAILLGLVPATIASRKGKKFAVWWLYGTALLILALPHALLLKPDRNYVERVQISEKMPFLC